MIKEEKNQLIDILDKSINENRNFYLADISGLTAEESSNLRRLCFKREVSLQVVKNTLLKKALEKNDSDFKELYDVLKGNTSIMFTDIANAPAKIIKEFRKKHDKPIFKAAHLDNSFYIGEDYLNTLSELKSKNELISEIILLLQSPIKNVISSLQSSGNKLSGILNTLSENTESACNEEKTKEAAPDVENASEEESNEEKTKEAAPDVENASEEESNEEKTEEAAPDVENASEEESNEEKTE